MFVFILYCEGVEKLCIDLTKRKSVKHSYFMQSLKVCLFNTDNL